VGRLDIIEDFLMIGDIYGALPLNIKEGHSRFFKELFFDRKIPCILIGDNLVGENNATFPI